MAQGFWQTLSTLQVAGTALTAAARASMTQGTGATQSRYTLPGNALKYLGDQLRVYATGIISCAVTTPGTARFDVAIATAAVMDTQAMPLNIVAQTNTPWILDLTGTVTTTGTAGVLTWTGLFTSSANINSALPATGPGPGGQVVPYSGTATGGSTASAAINFTISNLLDLYFTQTVATGSCQLLQMNMSILTSTQTL
jgi:hypothetical protein